MTNVLVTGAGRRLGRAVALFLAQRQFRVAVHYRNSREAAAKVVQSIVQEGGRAVLVSGDLQNESECGNIIQKARSELGSVDVLVNNASSFTEDTVMDFSFEQLAMHMRINAFAPLQLCRAFAAQRTGGCIVNFLDSKVVSNDEAHASYHLSKRVFDTLTQMLAIELAPEIRVNAIAPGLILPPEGKGEAYVEMRKKEIPLNRQGTLQDICRAVYFLIQSDFVTGQTIFVDGGRHLNNWG